MSSPTLHPAPITRRTLFAAGFLDQMVFLGLVVLGLGAGLLRADASDGSGWEAGVGLCLGILAALVCVGLQIWLAVRYRSTAGLFLMGIRFDASRPVDWFDDAADWLLSFWSNIVLAPMVWAVNKVSRRLEEEGTGFVPDRRARSGAGRLARAVLAVLLVATPLPLALAVLA